LNNDFLNKADFCFKNVKIADDNLKEKQNCEKKQRRQSARDAACVPVRRFDDGPALGVQERLHPVVQLLAGRVQLGHGPAEVTRHFLQVQGLTTEQSL